MRKKVLNILQYFWIAAILIAASLYVIKKYDHVMMLLNAIPISKILIMLSLIVTGKVFLVVTMLFSLRLVNSDLRIHKVFYIYNITQLGKYLPGFIWQYLGKIGLYSRAGLTSTQISTSMLIEISIDQIGAILLGLYVFATPIGAEVINLIGKNRLYIISVTFLVLAIIAVIYRFRKKIWSLISILLNNKRKLLGIAFVQAALWASLGLSLYVITDSVTRGSYPALYVISLYSAAFFLGFIFPFAPAGLGIREAILVIGLSPVFSTTDALIIASLNRICYVLVELLLVGIAFLGNLIYLKTKKSGSINQGPRI